MLPHPVQIHAQQPERYDRIQLLVRLLVVMVAGTLGIPAWPFGLFYLALPLVAAVLLTSQSGEHFMASDAPRIARVLAWLFEALAYLTLVTDRLPVRAQPRIRVQITPGGTPTLGSALLRLLTSVPSALVLLLCGMVSWVVVVIAALCVLVSTSYPRALWGFQLAVLRWNARLFVYHASLTDVYPPFALDTSHDESEPEPGALTA